MRILLYISSLHAGGAERVMANLANQFVNDNYEVVLVTTYQDIIMYPIEDRIKHYAITEYKTGFLRNLAKNIKILANLSKIINREKPDVIISFMSEPVLRHLLVNPKNAKTIISIRNNPSNEYAGVKGYLAKYLFKRADVIVCQTNDVINWLPEKLRSRATVIMNQVDPIFFKTQTKEKLYYVATGRLYPQKNYPLLIDAFSRFASEYPNEKLLIFGEGCLNEELQRKITQLGMDNNIFLMGNADSVAEVLSKAKCFVLSSDYEGMPNGLLEAQAIGLPCISTDCPCGGPRTIIENNKNGILVPVADEKALYNALKYIQDNPEAGSLMGKNAKEKSLSFSPEYVFRQWKELI